LPEGTNQSEARFVVVLLGHGYPKKIWTKFESYTFEEHLVADSVTALGAD
jgi:hypothetical protein